MTDPAFYWKRLSLCADIIRFNGEVSRLQLASKLTEKKMPCTPWTIDKIKPDILELYSDIIYNKTEKKFIFIDFASRSLSLQEKEALK